VNAKGLTALVLILIAGICSAEVMVENLRCEYLQNPLGIDVVKPRLSWITESNQRGWMQSAYQILVASSEDILKQDKGDLWDSGKIQSDRSIHVVYAGRKLESCQRCYWKVRVWDKKGKVSAWSQPALWTMGLLKPEDWQGAQWIGLEQTEKKAKKPVDEFFLLELAGAKTHRLARIVIYNYGQEESGYNYYSKNFSVEVSTTSKDKKAFKRVLAGTLKAETGAQTFALEPVDARYVKLRIGSGYQEEFIELGEFEVYSSEGANVAAAAQGGKLLEYSSEYPTHLAQGIWPAANIIDGAKSGLTGSWCSKGEAPEPGTIGLRGQGRHSRLPARYVRREFEVNKPVKCATAYVCGLGESDLFLNGREVTDRERDPGIMMYNKRLLYVTFDVTDYLKQGANGVGVILGNGRYFSPRGKGGHALHFGKPKLLLLMRIEYLDGTTQELASDENWKVTDQGPIRANNEYDGEEYDARMELPGWSKAGFNDSEWQPAELVKSPGGKLEAFMYEPMRVTEVLKPVAITNPDPGVYIVDMGQGFYGTVKLKVSGPAGTRVQMRSSFSLFENGRFNVLNNRSARTTDVYILKGKGKEVWYPRFRGQGYRYVEVTGFPGVPSKNNFEGLFIHCDVEETGFFECSNPLVNKINKMMHYDQLGQKRGATMDPDREERQGWLGGSFVYVEDESAHANVAAHYTKWLEDIRFDQRPDGAVSDVSPALWQTYTGDLVWPADLVLVPLAIHKYYGDRRVLQENYEAMKKWFKYAQGVLKDDFTVDHNRYGDWCDTYNMDGKGPGTGSTSKPLISTAFYSFLHARMAQIATLLGKDEEAKQFAGVAQKVKQAFNKRFFDPATNTYESKTQCAYVLPLAMGLVPEDRRQAVIDNLVQDIMVTHKQHVSTGLVGMFFYMRTLMNANRGDVAYAVANQKTRPSWGYMVSKGASGMWERWDQDTQGPGMNGQGFLMLTGDLNAWIYQGLAGINPDPQRPGFKHIILHPQPAGDLTYVNASYKSMHGRIESNWKREGDTFRWQVTVPANTTATVYVPAKDATGVTESGKPAGKTNHLKFIRMEEGRAVFDAGSGTYEFRSTMK